MSPCRPSSLHHRPLPAGRFLVVTDVSDRQKYLLLSSCFVSIFVLVVVDVISVILLFALLLVLFVAVAVVVVVLLLLSLPLLVVA